MRWKGQETWKELECVRRKTKESKGKGTERTKKGKERKEKQRCGGVRDVELVGGLSVARVAVVVGGLSVARVRC